MGDDQAVLLQDRNNLVFGTPQPQLNHNVDRRTSGFHTFLLFFRFSTSIYSLFVARKYHHSPHDTTSYLFNVPPASRSPLNIIPVPGHPLPCDV
ncbi:hypothetical protein JAAARDRAFT_327080 [Jaapia argillacea MUCL 33604]|uniref:Uncharacterized protein n=1 Tax=Jaapia argillacea MUCL 33604 TaxID=933084 RepID=A0A067PZC9_9AGAM|nr:hypothetical protein JAAARDRAFT_327080 [Jaapia argillacea MUCL 33604]